LFALLLLPLMVAPAPRVRADETPATVSAAQFLSGAFDGKRVTGTCVVKDAFRDEINPNYGYLVLLWDNETVYAAVKTADTPDADISGLVGAEVAVEGIVSAKLYGQREKLGRNLQIAGRSDIRILRKPTDDPFDVPDVTELDGRRPEELSHVGRRRFSGRVVAAWSPATILLRGTNARGTEEYVSAKLSGLAVPTCGESIVVSGFPETDLYHYTLVRAHWHPHSAAANRDPPVQDVTAKSLSKDDAGRRRYRQELHGQLVRIRGRVRSLPDTDDPNDFLLVDDGTGLVSVNASGNAAFLDGIDEGCSVEVTGTCVMEIESWQFNSTFPQIRGFFIVPRTADDLRVTARPPWWTTGKLLSVIGALAAALAFFLVWSVSLRLLAERRGRQLFRAEIASAKSTLKTEERTRLAVELHDSLSQTLTGVSMELAAAEDLRGDAPPDMLAHLDIASRTLKSCRDELRNCLWDLRSEALDETDITSAVRRTLQPHVNDTRLKVRFNVPRARLSDNTAHAILRIIRELVVNALRHGQASEIRVAGSLDRDALRFSVKDDGCGFDPDDSPGVLQGHFGLQGVRERVEKLGGEVTIESAPGKGARISVILGNSANHPA